ncbi:hypothetical protein Tco_0319254 [Tanacetum coccineum]
MLEIILHQQRTLHLLKQKTLMQTQEDHSHQTQAVNSDSLKVDLVVIQNTCSEKEDSNSETASSKSAKECSLKFSNTRWFPSNQIPRCQKQKMRCHDIFSISSFTPSSSFKDTEKHSTSNMDSNGHSMSLFGQNVEYFTEQCPQHTYFVEYTGIEVQHFRDTLLQHLGNVKKYERRVNKRQMQTQESKIDTGKALDANLVDTESIRTDSTVQDDSSRSGNDTDADDADIRPIYDGRANAGRTVPNFKRFFKNEHIALLLELKYQNQSLKSGQHGQILKQTSNKAKIEKEIDVLETMNIELEHSVATLRKENETLKQHYKDLYDSIKITRSKTTELQHLAY